MGNDTEFDSPPEYAARWIELSIIIVSTAVLACAIYTAYLVISIILQP